MTPKEKANNIYSQMLEWADDAHLYKERNIICITSKKSALICVDEVLQTIPEEVMSYKPFMMNTDYWQEVKEEINKL